MSGGHFDYKQYDIERIADEVEHLIWSNGSTEEDEYGYPTGRNYAPETIAEFKEGLRILQEAAIYTQRIDWLASCDASEDSFHRRLALELAKLKQV